MHIPFAFLLIAFLSVSACQDKDAGKPSSERNELQRACRNDIQKLCKKVEAGEGRVVRCLREQRKKLSDDCRKELKERAEN